MSENLWNILDFFVSGIQKCQKIPMMPTRKNFRNFHVDFDDLFRFFKFWIFIRRFGILTLIEFSDIFWPFCNFETKKSRIFKKFLQKTFHISYPKKSMKKQSCLSARILSTKWNPKFKATAPMYLVVVTWEGKFLSRTITFR